MIEFTVAFYTKDRYPAVCKAIESLDKSTPVKLPVLVVEDQPKFRLRNDSVFKALFSSRERLNILEMPQKLSCSRLMNSCIVFSEGRYVLLCNDDLVFKPGWFDVAQKYIENYPIVLMYNFGACLIDKTILPKMGYFDEGFLGGSREDQSKMIQLILNDIPSYNTWEETGEKLIFHEPNYYISACWNGEQNEKHFINKWGSIDYIGLCQLAREKKIKPKIEDVDWYPFYTKFWGNQKEK